MKLYEFLSAFDEDTDFVLYDMLGNILGRGNRITDEIVSYCGEEIIAVRCNDDIENTLDISLYIF